VPNLILCERERERERGGREGGREGGLTALDCSLTD
jgi:hypothetical protein